MSWEQVGNAITFHVFYMASKVGKTGLTVTVDVDAPDGTALVTAGNAVEVRNGTYKYTLAAESVTAIGEYIAIFKTTDATVDAKHLPSLMIVGRAGVENLDASILSRSTYAGGAVASVSSPVTVATNNDKTGYALTVAPPTAAAIATAVWGATEKTLTALGFVWDKTGYALTSAYDAAKTAATAATLALVKAKTDLITTGTFTRVPVTSDGGLMIITKGDAYTATQGWGAIEADADSLPDISEATVYLIIGSKSFAATATPNGDNYTLSCELTSQQTGTLTASTYEFICIWEDVVVPLGERKPMITPITGVVKYQ